MQVSNYSAILLEDVIWYTDGSKIDKGTKVDLYKKLKSQFFIPIRIYVYAGCPWRSKVTSKVTSKMPKRTENPTGYHSCGHQNIWK